MEARVTRVSISAPRVTRMVERVAWLLLLVGGWLMVAPARVPDVIATAARSVAPVPPPVPAATDDNWLASNPFSASRRPPGRRWLPNDTSPALSDAVVPSGGSEVPRLFGTLVGPGGSSALLRLDAAMPGARLYMEGDRGGVYRVRRILDDRVILDGPSGRIELRLRRGEARP